MGGAGARTGATDVRGGDHLIIPGRQGGRASSNGQVIPKMPAWQAHEYHESWKSPGLGPVFFTICSGVNKDVESPWFP